MAVHVPAPAVASCEREWLSGRPTEHGQVDVGRSAVPQGALFDLLKPSTYAEFLLYPERLSSQIEAAGAHTIIIDEIQRLPGLLDEVHRLIESWRSSKLQFILTGSSTRKLRRGGANLLTGRAGTRVLHPLTAAELGEAYDLNHSLRYGQLPTVYTAADPQDYLASYVGTYLREEVQAETHS